MPNLNLSGGTAVSRTGATKTWSSLAVPLVTGTYQPGDKSFYARFKVLPSSPLAALPSTLSLLIGGNYSPASSGTFIIDDLVSLGDASAPGSNVAVMAPVSGNRNYLLGTGGFTLADLNAGNVYLWLGYRADPTSYSGYSVSVSPTSPVVVRGGSTVSSNPTFSITPSGPGAYAVVDISSTSTGDGYAGGFIAGYTGTASVDNGLGVTDSGAIQEPTPDPPPSERTASSTVRRLIPTAQSFSFSPSGTSAISVGGPTNVAQVTHSVSASVVTPDASTLTLDTLVLSFTSPTAAGGVDGPMLGSFLSADLNEMTTAYIDDTFTFWAQTTQASTGSAFDATGSPSYRIYEETTDTPILTGSLALQDDANTVGFYRGQATLSAANGFEVGKCYCVRVAATVDAIAQAGMVERFVVRPAVATSVWGALDGGNVAGRATTVLQQLGQIYRYLFNKNTIQSSAQTVYLDNSTTVMLSGSQSATDVSASRGKLS
ncbi:hypothetical protein [Fimbriimonas ginsengisoli]|uniref:Uncharacterized protein n=1 Tax=Fimbriimonas ginsengisoli Gsoil 348 TaxID=661478 RepID=A0A068NUF2_FIMGI|nr:hypothetical protein [Fimbriimonas ginsengisoli]AIE86987.1 hypothetical protein OP10G_3619 [Fimbriimonas ginsengisoli Gsoil 348]